MKKLLLFILLGFTTITSSQENVKIMTYNLLNYPGSDASVRNPYFKKVIRNSNPDILVVQEMQSQAGMNGFLSNVMNAYGNNYSAGVFIDGTDTDNGIFFRTSRFTFISNTRIRTALRDINEFKIIHVNYPLDTLRIYSVHLKAGSDTLNEISRAAEVDSLRKVTNQLAVNALYMIMGDCNIYGSYEFAYIKLLQVNGNNRGHFIDPIPNMTGVWNNPSYSIYHTQSPRVRSFGNGSTGGMDDRFDLILNSPSISTSGRIAYVANSLTPYGNDGNHYNDSINQRPNTAVPDSIADAIHYAADHIPVLAIYTFGNSIGITPIGNEIPAQFKLEQNYPNPFNPVTNIKFQIPLLRGVSALSGRGVFTKLTVLDILGREVATLVNEHLKVGEYEVSFNGSNYSSGIYFYRMEVNGFAESRKMLMIK